MINHDIQTLNIDEIELVDGAVLPILVWAAIEGAVAGAALYGAVKYATTN